MTPDGTVIRETKSSRENGGWFNDYKGDGDKCVGISRTGSRSQARKAASAMIAKIPLPLSTYIARAFKPQIQPIVASIKQAQDVPNRTILC